jgi:hypothetical protein
MLEREDLQARIDIGPLPAARRWASGISRRLRPIPLGRWKSPAPVARSVLVLLQDIRVVSLSVCKP